MAWVRALRARSEIPFDAEVHRLTIAVQGLSRDVSKVLLPDGPHKEQEAARLNALIQDRVTHLQTSRALQRRAIAFDAEADELEQEAQALSKFPELDWPISRAQYEEKIARRNRLVQERMAGVKMLRAAADELAANAGAGPDWRLHLPVEVDDGEEKEEEEQDEFLFHTICGDTLKVVTKVFNCKAEQHIWYRDRTHEDCEAVRVYSNDYCSRGLELIAVYPTDGCLSRAKTIPDVCRGGACAHPIEETRCWLRDRLQEGYTPDSVDDFLETLEEYAGES